MSIELVAAALSAHGRRLVVPDDSEVTDLARYSAADLRVIEHRLNTMPRRTLHWSSAHDVCNAALAMTG